MSTKRSSRRIRLASYTISKSQSGFSLVELMVAGTISLLMMVAILQLMLDMARTNDDMARTNVQIENGRFAIQMLGYDLMHAGFWDGYIPEYDDLTSTDAPVGFPADFIAPLPCTPIPVTSYPANQNLLRMPIQSFPTMPERCSENGWSYKEGTDVLVVRYANTCVAGVGGCAGEVSGRTYFQSSRCEAEPAYRFSKKDAGADLTNKSCLPSDPAPKRVYIENIYFISSDSTLMRAEYMNDRWQVQPMVDGVEEMVIELGVDRVRSEDERMVAKYDEAIIWADPLNKRTPVNRGDGEPDGPFLRCVDPKVGCPAEELLNVVAAKIFLLVRSSAPSPDYFDGKTYRLGSISIRPGGSFKRHVYSTSIRLHNVAGRRETP